MYVTPFPLPLASLAPCHRTFLSLSLSLSLSFSLSLSPLVLLTLFSSQLRQDGSSDIVCRRLFLLPVVVANRNYTLSIILGTVALSYGSVPMYKMICQTTGWGGQPVRAPGHGGGSGSGSGGSADVDPSTRLVPVTTAPRIRVTFNASVSDVLPWRFVPQQREVRVLPGETALAFYTATNRSDRDIIGVATYSVTPAQVAPYFSKIQCFCFEEQRLAAGETVDMPVFFYLDPDLLNDLNMRGVGEVTLSYTFFSESGPLPSPSLPPSHPATVFPPLSFSPLSPSPPSFLPFFLYVCSHYYHYHYHYYCRVPAM